MRETYKLYAILTIILLSVTKTDFIYATGSINNTQNIYSLYQKEAEKIYDNMSLDERIGQIVLPSYALLARAVSNEGSACKLAVNDNTATEEKIVAACGLNQISQYHLGAVLMDGGPYYNTPTLKHWAQLNHLAQQQHQLGNPKDPILLTGNDAVHGNSHVQGAVIFPHNIGLGTTHDTKLIRKMAALVAEDSLASGFNWVYAPTVAIAKDLRWGRSYESFAKDPALVKDLAKNYIEGLQDIQNHKIQGVLATAKHFLGDGATQYGLDEGDDVYQGSEAQFWEEQARGYEAAIEAEVGSIMVSYSAIDGDNTRMHFGGKWDLINQFKRQGIQPKKTNYQFSGFMVSDWNAATRAAYFYNKLHGTQLNLSQIMAKALNGGVDMLMVGQGDTINPFDPNSKANFTTVAQVIEAIKTAYKQKLISEQRLKEAVIRILRVKLAMNPQIPANYNELQIQERTIALKAAEKSLVLIKNENHMLPINPKRVSNIVFIGETNDLGLQNGGWTINWQGQKSNQYFTGADKLSSGATTLEEGIKDELKDRSVNYYHVNSAHQQELLATTLNRSNTLVIALVAEAPYAEYMGDIANDKIEDRWYKFGVLTKANSYYSLPQNKSLALNFNPQEANVIQKLKARGIKVITIVYSGRPLKLNQERNTSPLKLSDALIAAFLPGTLGGKAIANAIFGHYSFTKHSQSNHASFPFACYIAACSSSK